MKNKKTVLIAGMMLLALVCVSNAFAECDADVTFTTENVVGGILCPQNDQPTDGSYLGCVVENNTSGSRILCSANDGQGNTFQCSSTNANLVKAVDSAVPLEAISVQKSGSTCLIIKTYR